jgi:S-adenosylmethionine synthetase
MAMADAHRYTFSSESVSEGHPDKVADYVADSILDAYIAQDAHAKVACEVLVKEDRLILAGEITADATVDHAAIARGAVTEIGYTEAGEPFNADTITINDYLTAQSVEINQAVVKADSMNQGAGDQGIMFGYATDETAELMPLPILLSHRLARTLARHRHERRVDWLRPDSKTQVSVLYDSEGPVQVTDVLVSTQHTPAVNRAQIEDYIRHQIIAEALAEWNRDSINLIVNPSGSFVHGGPSADAGVTGRKIIVDTYGGMGRHGGGAFSGKDPSKVEARGDPGRVRHRRGAAGIREGRHVRHRRRAGRRGVRARLRLPPRSHHRTPEPAPADLPQDDELRPLRQARTALGER